MRSSSGRILLPLFILLPLCGISRVEAESQNSLVVSATTESEVLLRGRAGLAGFPYWWTDVTLQFRTPEGSTVQSATVDSQGFFFATIPQGQELTTLLVDHSGQPVSAEGTIGQEDQDLRFEPLPYSQRVFWVEDGNGEGFRFLIENRAEPTQSPRFLYLFPASAQTEASRFEKFVLQEIRSQSALIVRPQPGPADRLDTHLENTVANLLVAPLLEANGLTRNRVVLVGEGETGSQILPFPGRFRDLFGGVLTWGGRPPGSPLANYLEVPVALLGEREDLRPSNHWVELLGAADCAVLSKSYWSTPSDPDLSSDVKQALDWVTGSKPPEPQRKMVHSTYLPLHGKVGWVWITGLSQPGAMGTVRAEWHKTDLIEIAVDRVRSVRVNLDSGFARFGTSITLVIGNLTVPTTFAQSRKAIELEKEGDTWTHRFIDFATAVVPVPVARILPPGIAPGADLPELAEFVRARLEVDCAWGHRAASGFPEGLLTDNGLFYAIPPSALLKVSWDPAALSAFQAWRLRKATSASQLKALVAPTDSGTPGPRERLTCAVEEPILLEYFQDRPQMKTETEPLSLNLQELVGLYLAEKHPVQ